MPTNLLPPIYFYIPQNKWPSDYMPGSPNDYWQWYKSRPHQWLTTYHWTLQTYLHLKADGFPCQLIDIVPSEGIVLSHRYFFPGDFLPGPRLLMVCLQGDAPQHPYAQLHVVQNPKQENPQGFLTLYGSYYIPHWPHPSLIPRDPLRGDQFKNIAFFGYDENLAPELKEPFWYEQINVLGLSWHVVSNFRQFNDYSYVDAVLAVRSFKPQGQYNWKPASKLYNAWAAGVPAILGCESAFRAERKNEIDYLEVASLSDVILALKRLRDNKELRRAMVENGRVRTEETQPVRIVSRWRSFLLNKAVPAYEHWCATPKWRKQSVLKTRRYLGLKINGFQRRILPLVARIQGY